MSDNKIFLDLDAIVPEKDVFIVLDKQEHRLAPLTVEQFVINMRNMEKLGKGNLDVETEQGMIVNMLEQVFLRHSAGQHRGRDAVRVQG